MRVEVEKILFFDDYFSLKLGRKDQTIDFFRAEIERVSFYGHAYGYPKYEVIIYCANGTEKISFDTCKESMDVATKIGDWLRNYKDEHNVDEG